MNNKKNEIDKFQICWRSREGKGNFWPDSILREASPDSLRHKSDLKARKTEPGTLRSLHHKMNSHRKLICCFALHCEHRCALLTNRQKAIFKKGLCIG